DQAARLAGQYVNDVLRVYSGVFDATGIYTDQFKVAAGCVIVDNLGIAAHIVTVSVGGPVPAGSVTPTGIGTWLVAGGHRGPLPLAAHQFTLYGTTGDSFCYAAFTAPFRPAAG